MTVEVTGSTRSLLVAVQEMLLAWSLLEIWLMTRLLLTRPVAVSMSSPTAGRGTSSFLQTMEGVGSPPWLVQYSLTSPPSSTARPAWLEMRGLLG